MKHIRLRLHVQEELFGTRVSPTSRKRDPMAARKPKAHILTVGQADLWRALFDGRNPSTMDLPPVSLEELVGRLRTRAPEAKIEIEENMIEICQKRKS